MKKYLIVYNSKYGQTEKIARYIQHGLKTNSIDCTLHDITKSDPELNEFDRVIIGGSVYAGKFNKYLIGWAQRSRSSINRKDPVFFSVALNAADTRPQARKDDQRLINEFIKATGLKPTLTESIAGALNYRDYNFVIRFIIKKISQKAGGPTDTSKNYELTDWQKVDSFIQRLK